MGYEIINTLWQEIVEGGGGIGRPPDSDLYGDGNSPQLCEAQSKQRSRVVVASLLVPREIHILGPSGRIWMGDPFIGGYDDVMVEVMMTVGCRMTRIVTALGHDIWDV